MPVDVSRPDLTLAVIGTGVMGRGIAQIAAQAGIRVLLQDSRPAAAQDRKSTRLNSSHIQKSRMPSSA